MRDGAITALSASNLQGWVCTVNDRDFGLARSRYQQSLPSVCSLLLITTDGPPPPLFERRSRCVSASIICTGVVGGIRIARNCGCRKKFFDLARKRCDV